MHELKDTIAASIAKVASQELADCILAEYQDVVNRYSQGDHRPEEQSGGRFAEAAFRICQHACKLDVTPVGRSLPRVDGLAEVLGQTSSTIADDGFRIHIPRALRLIYGFRNTRDVAHLGVGVSPNYADSTLVLSITSWVLCENVRICHECSIDEAQVIVDSLADRRVPLIWDDGKNIRVLEPTLDFKQKTLLVLSHLDPERPSVKRLFEAVEYSNLSVFRRKILEQLHADALIDYRNEEVVLLPPGKKVVEQEIMTRVRL